MESLKRLDKWDGYCVIHCPGEGVTKNGDLVRKGQLARAASARSPGSKKWREVLH